MAAFQLMFLARHEICFFTHLPSLRGMVRIIYYYTVSYYVNLLPDTNPDLVATPSERTKCDVITETA